MNPTNVYTVVFSPTGTSKKVADGVVKGLNDENSAPDNVPTGEEQVQARTSSPAHTQLTTPAPRPTTTIDLTHEAGKPVTLANDAVAIFGVPVYGGKVAPVALERMKNIRGKGTPAVLIAIYGNRAFESAVVQLAEFVTERGFIPVAAAAFVGEHSYSTPDLPIAAGRPDARDLADAAAFGVQVAVKLSQTPTLVDPDTSGPSGSKKIFSAVDPAKLRAPRTPFLPQLRFIRFVLGYRRRQKRNPIVLLPAGNAARCTQCGLCVALCPTQAIARGDELHTDPSRCIRCCACVKGCTFGARTFETPFGAALSRSFSQRKPPVTLL